jgi:hypothetical protein
MKILNLAFQEVGQSIAAVEMRYRVVRRRTIRIFAGVAVEGCTSRSEVVVLDDPVRGAVGDGLVVDDTLAEDAGLDGVLTPDFGEIVADIGLELVEVQGTE